MTNYMWIILTGEKIRSTQGKKLVPVALCSPQIPHGLACVWTWASELKGRWLTTRATAWPVLSPCISSNSCCSSVVCALASYRGQDYYEWSVGKYEGASSSCVYQRQSWCLMRPNKATKKLVHYFQVVGQDLSLKPDSERGMSMPTTLIVFLIELRSECWLTLHCDRFIHPPSKISPITFQQFEWSLSRSTVPT